MRRRHRDQPECGQNVQSRAHCPGFVAPALRATETLRPAQLTQILPTGSLAGESRLELGQIPGVILHRPDSGHLGHLGTARQPPSPFLLERASAPSVTVTSCTATRVIGANGRRPQHARSCDRLRGCSRMRFLRVVDQLSFEKPGSRRAIALQRASRSPPQQPQAAGVSAESAA
jgi:hypothetical protein